MRYTVILSIVFVLKIYNADGTDHIEPNKPVLSTPPEFKNSGKDLGIEIWRVEKSKPIPYPKNDYGTFHSGDAYIVLQTFKDNEGKLAYRIYKWIGKDTPTIINGSATNLSFMLNYKCGEVGKILQEDDGHESEAFKDLFKSNFKTVDGSQRESHFKNIVTNASGEKKLYIVKGVIDAKVKRVDLSVKSLNKEDCFVLDAGSEVYIYQGIKTTDYKKVKAIAVANMVRDIDHHGRSHVTIIDTDSDKGQLDEFFKALESGSDNEIAEKSFLDDKAFEDEQDRTLVLYKVIEADGKVSKQIIEQKPYKKDFLHTKDCYILDTKSAGIFVWTGKESSLPLRKRALEEATALFSKENSSSWAKVERVAQLAEPTVFRQYFIDWTDGEMKHSNVVNKNEFHCSY